MNPNIDQDLWQKIENFVRRETGVCKKKVLTLDSCIVSDLRIDGEDGAEFIENYGSLFNVDLESFNYEDYFHGDYFDPIGLSSLIFYVKRKISKQPDIPIRKNKKPLTLDMLYNSALKGRWLYGTDSAVHTIS